jgi:DNA-binding NarL/FixJ family response regulator
MALTKRVILADGSRLLREMLHRVIDKANHLQVVQELPNSDRLLSAIKRFDPAWVILSQPFNKQTHGWINACLTDHPDVRFIFLAPNQNHIKMKSQMSCEEDFPDLSLKEFIHILEKDLQHT